MLYSVGFLGALGVIEAVERAYKVACDTADTLELYLALFSVAARAFVVDYTRIAAAGIAVDGVVYCAVAYTLLLHEAYYLLKCVKVLQRVAVKLDIADMTAVCKRMIRCLALDLVIRGYIIVNRNMEWLELV